MKLKDRIKNIKTLLKYCSHSTADVKIIEEKVGLFFANFFNNDDRFTKTPYDHVYPRIYLTEHLNLDFETHGTTIGIEYCYDSDRDGNYFESYYFNDPDLKDTYLYKEHKNNPYYHFIEYSEVPDYVWEIIQNKLYEKATENVNKELESAKSLVKYWKEKKEEFDNKLKLNK
jgi:hypothetical protein